tara:strand:- start:2342 stop:2575 length:234 start_codon:yes stop_codon:yes gene_type:complete
MRYNEKRYVVTMDVYVYAENDYMARKRAHKMADSLDKYGRNPSITEIGEQPFASIEYRKLEDISRPVDKVKNEKLPF